jgi:molybdate transport system ATP-binding protein
MRVTVSGPIRIVAEVTRAAASDLRLVKGERVWASIKATEIDVYPV